MNIYLLQHQIISIYILLLLKLLALLSNLLFLLFLLLYIEIILEELKNFAPKIFSPLYCYRAGGDGGGRTHKKSLQSFQFSASLHPHRITLCIKTDKAFTTPNSACIVEPATLYALRPGFS